MEPGAVPGAGDAARVPAPAATETVTPVAAAAAALGPDEVVRLSQFLSRMDLELSQLREQVHGLSMHAVPEGVTAATSGPSGRPVAAPVGASAGAVPAVHAVSARPVLPAQTQHDVRVNLDRSKVWREAFESAQITGEASPDFPMTMNRLARLRETAPPVGAARAELEIEWMSFAFAGHARRYLFQLQERHAGESAWELLARMRQRFYNEIHVTSAKMRWETLKMHERESVQSFAERVSDLATCQAEVPTDKDLLIRFLSGLPASLQEWSLLVGASFPEAVTVVQRNAQRNALRAGRRVVDEVEGEPAGDAGASDGAAGLMQGPQSVPGPGTLVTTVVPQFAWPGGALPVQYGVQSTTSRGQAEQGSERGPRRQAACWYCGKTGHRRDQCRKLLADKAKAEVPKN
ncbi:hypothetical protein FVE85_7615 [Porphyridium purpureum]|uniref:CCHC-type domain-containing protein n=1 Tax=Porphyridium purpureum TaxID=35688 RepID=A0A5J4ZA76_PORPP|nr:hypothetical protein FVE85_7615 [Porphyridium purpureum]|eukprot:POR0872..scf295_1